MVHLSTLVFLQMYSYSLTCLAYNKQIQRIVPSIKLVLEIETNVSRKRESCQKLICFLISPLRCNCNPSQYLCTLIKKTLEEQGVWFTAPPLLQPLSHILQPLLGPPAMRVYRKSQGFLHPCRLASHHPFCTQWILVDLLSLLPIRQTYKKSCGVQSTLFIYFGYH